MRLSTLTKKNRNAKGWKMKWFLFAFIMLIVIYFLIQGIRCIIGYHKAQEKLNSLEVKTASLSYGPMTYIDQGEGDVILSVHGIFGGYDQAYESVKNRASKTASLHHHASAILDPRSWEMEHPQNKPLRSMNYLII